jgi:hypothetical protein
MAEIHGQISNISAFFNEVSATVLDALRNIFGVIT